LAYRDGDQAVIGRIIDDDWSAVAAVPSIIPAPVADLGDARPRSRTDTASLPRCPEIDCVRHLLPPLVIDLAELRAAKVGVGADRVLIASGAISEETYVAALAASLGMAFEPLFKTSREHCPLSGDQLIEAANTGMLPLSDHNGFGIVVSPRLVDSRRLVAVAASRAGVAYRIRLTSTARLHDYVARHCAQDIERRAVDALRMKHPEFSAGVGRSRRMVTLAYLALIALTVFAMPGAALMVTEVLLGVIFLAWTGLRLLGLLSERFLRRRQRRTFNDGWLPVYSIVIALYREAAAVPGLVAALRALDYPGIRAQTPQAV